VSPAAVAGEVRRGGVSRLLQVALGRGQPTTAG